MEQHNRPKRSGWIIAVVTMFVLPLLYVLSSGPVTWLVNTYLDALNPRVVEFFAVVYAPLSLLYGYSPAFASFLDWYVTWWVSGIP